MGHDFGRIPLLPPAAAAIRTKLAINQPGDEYEQEADRVAEQVMRMPEPRRAGQCACGGTCSKCQSELSSPLPERLQTKSVSSRDAGQSAAPPIVHEVLASPGRPLDAEARAFMERRFGHDFGHIRVHCDERAGDSARVINALAYSAGHHMVFGAGHYSPTTTSGRQLLAHELAHSLQQQSSGGLSSQEPGDHGDSLQRPADLAGDVIYRKGDKKDDKCRKVLTQRWGCDTACSRAGFIDKETPFTDEHGERGKSSCCNKWPPFVESFAIHNLGLNGAASCKGAMFRKIFRVNFKDKTIRIACTDTTTSTADHDLEISPAAAVDLFDSVEFPLNTEVEVCPDGDLSNLCEPDASKLNNPRNPSFPRQRDCIEKGCIPQDNSVVCERYGWPST